MGASSDAAGGAGAQQREPDSAEIRLLASRLGVSLPDEDLEALVAVHQANREVLRRLRAALSPTEEPAIIFARPVGA